MKLIKFINVCLFVCLFVIPLFSLDKKGYINFVLVGLSSNCLSVCPSVTFLVNASPPKLLDFVAE